MNVSGVKRFPEAQDQGSRKQFIFFPLLFTFVALVLNWRESLVIELQRKARLLLLLMSAIQLELRYISAIDRGAAGIWAVIINDVKAVMDNNTVDLQ